jgi:hypothetical protein
MYASARTAVAGGYIDKQGNLRTDAGDDIHVAGTDPATRDHLPCDISFV